MKLPSERLSARNSNPSRLDRIGDIRANGTVMHLRRRLRLALQSAGVDIARFPAGHPMHYLVKQLDTNKISCVLDVGSNDGGYARALRRFGFRGRIVSFEPLPDAFERAARAAARDTCWDVLPYAVGPVDAKVAINVAGNGGHSSSVLPMLDLHRQALPEASYVGSHDVEQRTLDGLVQSVVAGDDIVHLKIDVQGYERHVLEGASSTLDLPGLRGLQVEMSLVPLYEDAWTYEDVLEWARRHEFTLTQIIPGFTDQQTGRMLQVDAVFFREPTETERWRQ